MGKKAQRLSIKDIAALSDTSVATVSRVINDNGRFSPETEKRVKEVIDKYGYRPNKLARGLRQNKTNSVGIVVPDITNEYFANIILAMQNSLFEKDYALTIYNTNESAQLEGQCIDSLMSQQVSGYVCVNSKTDVSDRLGSDVPLVYIDRYAEDAILQKGRLALISSDNEKGGYLAGKELLRCGCSKPLVITALTDASCTLSRTNGFLRAFMENGMALSPGQILSPKAVNPESAQALVTDAIRHGVGFDCLFCQTDWLAVGALEALYAHDISVPEQVKVVGFDDISVSRFFRTPITTVRQDCSQIGSIAADIITALMERRPITDDRILVDVNLIRRATT